MSDVIQLEKLRVAPDGPLAEAQAAWQQIVGNAVAKNCQLVGEREGALEVRCSSSVWASELSLMSRELITKTNAVIGRKWAREVRFRVTE